MVVTNVGLSGLALLLGSTSASPPTHIAIGSGSGAVLKSNSGLVAETNRTTFTSTTTSTLNEVTWQADFSSTTMSGNSLKEFGLFNISSGGKCWVREGFGAVTFNGTQELQVSINWQIF